MTRISLPAAGSAEINELRRSIEAVRGDLAAARAEVDLERLIATIATRFINRAPDEIDAAISDALRLAGEVCGADRSYIILFSDDGTTMEYTYEWCAAGIPSVMSGFKGQAVATYPWWLDRLRRVEVIHVPRLSQLPAEARAERDLLHALGIRSHLIVPMVSENALIGCLGIGALRTEKTWEPTSIGLLRQVGEVFVNALLRQRTQRRLATQYTVANVLANCVTFREAFPKLLQSVCEGVGAELGELWRVDTASNRLRWAGTWHAPSLRAEEFEAISHEAAFLPGSGLLGRVWTSGQPEWMNEVADGRFVRAADAQRPALHEAFAFPIRSGCDVTGVMAFYSRSVLQHDDDLRQMLEALGSQTGTFIERTRAQDEARRLNVELEQRVIERTAELEAANRELEAFSYSVSHDLRAPLRGIVGFGQALVDEYAHRLDAQARDYLQRMRAAGQRMGQLIDDLLHLSRITRGEVHRQAVDLSVLAGTIAADLQKAQPLRQVAFVIAAGLTAHADPRLVRVALENLLGNAWKYTSKHGRARIELGASERGGERVYFVRDDGAGFEMAHVDRLFSPFQRLHTPTEFEGTGIGLATVQRIIHRHGGRIWAEGAVEHGATFYFTLDSRDRDHAASARGLSRTPDAHPSALGVGNVPSVRYWALTSDS